MDYGKMVKESRERTSKIAKKRRELQKKIVTPIDRYVEEHFLMDAPHLSQTIKDVDVPAIFGQTVAKSYIECGLIEFATMLARAEGR